jgi:uncharacterized protein (UPF0548 family)
VRWWITWPGTPADCAAWSVHRLSVDPSAVDGVTDSYRIDLATDAAEPGGVFGRAVDRLLRYDIFPPTLMRARVCTPDGRIAPDAVVVQRVRVGLPILESAVRVVDVWHHQAPGSEEAGFAYATLEDHPERGVSRFRVVRDGSSIRFEIEAISRPGSALTTIARPIARRVQQSATRAALRHFASG